MSQLLFRLCEASDGRKFAFLTDQPNVEDMFDSGYKVAYKYRDQSNGVELLARWRSSYMVKSAEFEKLPEEDELPDDLQNAFNVLMSSLIKGVDIFFCDYNLAISANRPICNDVLDKYRSTDFVLFSCEEMIGNDPRTQPYTVSYSEPRYPNSSNTGRQHRIYSKTDSFAFCQALYAIIIQREKDDLTGGHIRTEIDTYISEKTIDENTAEQLINRFIENLSQYSKNKDYSGTAALGLGAPDNQDD